MSVRISDRASVECVSSDRPGFPTIWEDRDGTNGRWFCVEGSERAAELMSIATYVRTEVWSHEESRAIASVFSDWEGTGAMAVTLYVWDVPKPREEAVAHEVAGRVGIATDESAWLKPLPEVLATIRDAFALSLTETAAVLGVERPTVYSWMREDSRPQAANRDRIQALYGLALTWRSMSPLPTGDHARRRFQDGQSLIELLESPSIDQLAVRRRLETIARHVGQDPLESGLYRASAEARAAIGSEHLRTRLDRLTRRPFVED